MNDKIKQKNIFGSNMVNSSKRILTKHRKQGIIIGFMLGVIASVLANYIYDYILNL
jgi:uncharacterized membrane protein YeaQ/YmgE (transglycosylase-associated protein family)